MNREYKAALNVRGDCLFCPLSFTIDSYWNCLVDCHHCSFRSLNHTWGQDLRPANPDTIYKKLTNGLRNKNPKSDIAHCIVQRKTIRFGSRSDPFQPAEDEHGVSAAIIEMLASMKWSFVIQTRFPKRMANNRKHLFDHKELFTFIPVISPGLDKDWEILERKRTDPIHSRIAIIKAFIKRGVNTGVNGEPFIPGYHTVKDFENTMKLLKASGIRSYNTYNFHFNPYVAKRLHAINIDIERIWHFNQDKPWRKILRKLMDLAKQYNIRLGIPDFVNSGWDHIEQTNTCCGVDVPNPTTFNSHHFKQLRQAGMNELEIIKQTWDHIGDPFRGADILTGEGGGKFYTLKDIIDD